MGHSKNTQLRPKSINVTSYIMLMSIIVNTKQQLWLEPRATANVNGL